MAVFKSPAVTAITGSPPTKRNPEEAGHAFLQGTRMLTTTDHDTDDVLVIMPLPSNIAVQRLLFDCGGEATAGAADIGLHYYDADSDEVTEIDHDLFATALSFAAAASMSDITGEAGTIDFEKRFMPLWEAAGLSADPHKTFWLTATITANVTGSSSNIMFQVLGTT